MARVDSIVAISIQEDCFMATKAPPSTIAQVKDVFTKLGEISDQVVFGDVWERKQLSKRDRSLITVAALTALYRPDQLRGHLHRAFDNGVTREEIIEVITHLAFYAGWPNAGTAALTAKEVFKERGA
jgi:4-carboxymuconolactone decarboxylase